MTAAIELRARLRRHIARHARESGTRHSARRIWMGSEWVREAVYISGRDAPRNILILAAMCNEMRTNDKAPRTILIAVERLFIGIFKALPPK